MVRAVASEARGPGFDSSSDQVVFILSLGVGGREINGSGNDNHVILRIHVDKKERQFLAAPSGNKLVQEEGM